MKDMLSNYNEFKTKRLRSLLKQITLFNHSMSFEDNGKSACIRYTIPKELEDRQWPLHSYVVLDYYAKKPRDRYIGLLKKLCGEIAMTPFDSSTGMTFSCLDEYILKLNIRGGK